MPSTLLPNPHLIPFHGKKTNIINFHHSIRTPVTVQNAELSNLTQNDQHHGWLIRDPAPSRLVLPQLGSARLWLSFDGFMTLMARKLSGATD